MLGKKFFELGLQLQTGKLHKPYFLKHSYTLRPLVSCALDYNTHSYEHQSITPAAMVYPAANRFRLQNGKIMGGVEAAPELKTCSRDDANIGFMKESAGKEKTGIMDEKTGITHENGNSVVDFWVLTGGPRGPPISAPNVKPITPPGMPDPVPIPEMPPIPPSGTPPNIPPPEMPPIPPDYPGPIPPPVEPPNTPWPGPEMPELPSPGPDVFPSPELPMPPSI